jgi:16S rRNA (cytosine1402-N4)-methyltransferase
MQSDNNVYHQPVMVQAVVEGLQIHPHGIYVDATFGGGGHARAILEKLRPGGHLFAFDQDGEAEKEASKITSPLFTFIRANTRFIKRFLTYHQLEKVDGLIADLGVSSHQIDVPERGFSTRWEGPLDMRMDQDSILTAAHIIHTYSYEALKRLFYSYGELRAAPLLAKAIVQAREKRKIETTESLKEVVLPFASFRHRAKFLARVFQSLRIEVNDELGALQALLEQSTSLLKTQGRLAVIYYHSLDGRLVKRFIKTGNFEGRLDTDWYGNPLRPFIPIFKKAMAPDVAELAANPRARSAKLWIGARTDFE